MEKISLANTPTPIQFYDTYMSNQIYIKRDDLSDLALGGNKVRKLEYFLADALQKKADCIVTYGAPQSNHCRITAAAANKYGLKTVLILSRTENPTFNGNYFLYKIFNVEIVWVNTNNVSQKIDETILKLRKNGYNPYFIQGGGHGNLGTHAYKLAFDEIIQQQEKESINFDYIFHASGTGTTQAGLIAGKIISNSNISIIGISVARNSNKGRNVIINSLEEYFNEFYNSISSADHEVIFDDSYVGNGYAHIYSEIKETIKQVARNSGILLDPVYTGKAFFGMLSYIRLNQITNKNILFIHTGGIPLLFNYANMFKEE